MIVAYHRPQSLGDALALLEQPSPRTLPLGGGTVLSHTAEAVAVVDLQALHLDQIEEDGSGLSIGAAATLESLATCRLCPSDLARAAYLEAGRHIRNMASVAGAIVTARGNAPLATALLALDARLTWLPGEVETSLGDFLPVRAVRAGAWPGKLIARVWVPKNVRLGYDFVARTPRDLPLVCAAVAQWPSGRTRVVVGGLGNAPILAMDGLDAGGAGIAAEAAAENAYSHFGNAQPIDPDYLKQTARTLVQRLLAAPGAA